jgi:L-ascorbate metabolism protein UlaG (beta-lactamase superfamily)
MRAAPSPTESNASRIVTPHFDGKRFFNPENRNLPGFREAVRMLWSYRPEKWPVDGSTPHVPRIAAQVPQGQAVVTFINHSTVLLQLSGLNIITDPIWAERASPFTWVGPKRKRAPGVGLSELPPLDVVLISHNHYDHLDLGTLEAIAARHASKVLVPLGNRALLECHGISNVMEFDWWDDVALAAGSRITFTPSQHFSARGVFDRNKTLWGTFLIEHHGARIYFGGDSGYSSAFRHIYERLGAPDLAFLPIGAYEPRWFMRVMHMNPAEAVQAHLDLHSRQSVAIHFGTFQLTEETPQRAVAELRHSLEARHVPASEFVVLREGQTEVFKFV